MFLRIEKSPRTSLTIIVIVSCHDLDLAFHMTLDLFVVAISYSNSKSPSYDKYLKSHLILKDIEK